MQCTSEQQVEVTGLAGQDRAEWKSASKRECVCVRAYVRARAGACWDVLAWGFDWKKRGGIRGASQVAVRGPGSHPNGQLQRRASAICAERGPAKYLRSPSTTNQNTLRTLR